MDTPTIRPGVTARPAAEPDLFAYFHSAASGNAAIQLLTALGVADDQLGVTPPELIDGGRGMLLSLVCPGDLLVKVEDACRSFGGAVHRAAR